MARTKAAARRGPEGHAFRENARKKAAESQTASTSGLKAAEGNAKGSGKRKRNRESAKKDEKVGEGNGAKRRKGDAGAIESAEGEKDGVNEKDRNGEQDETTTLPSDTTSPSLLVPIFPGLQDTHTVTTMSIISSSNINKKVSRILEVLSSSTSTATKPGGDEKGGKDGGKQDVVMLYAKAPVVSKLVSIAEIVKREIAKEGGKWYSYCCVGEVVGKKDDGRGDRRKQGNAEENGDVDMDVNGDEGGESEDEAFEVMKTPFERALEVEGKPKVRAMPVMSLYLSRVRIDGLRKVYG